MQISSNLANHANSFPESTGFPEWFVTFFFSGMRCCQLRNIIHSIYQPLILGLFGSRPKVCSNQEKQHTFLKMGIMIIMCGDIVLINMSQMIWLIPLLTKKDHWWIIIFRITHSHCIFWGIPNFDTPRENQYIISTRDWLRGLSKVAFVSFGDPPSL